MCITSLIIFGPLLASLIVYLLCSNVSALLDMTLQGLMAQSERMHIATIVGIVSVLTTMTVPLLFGHNLSIAIVLVNGTSIVTIMLQTPLPEETCHALRFTARRDPGIAPYTCDSLLWVALGAKQHKLNHPELCGYRCSGGSGLARPL